MVSGMYATSEVLRLRSGKGKGSPAAFALRFFFLAYDIKIEPEASVKRGHDKAVHGRPALTCGIGMEESWATCGLGPRRYLTTSLSLLFC